MTETMFAFLALSVVLIFSIGQQRVLVEAEREIAGVELEVLAYAVGSERLHFIATKAFDEHTRDGTVTPQNAKTNLLTAVAEFGANRPCGGAGNACADIDDFHQMQPDTVFIQLDTDDAGNPVGFEFVLTAEVNYINNAGNATPSRSWTKEVSLYVDHVVPASRPRYLLRPIQLKRRFSPLW